MNSADKHPLSITPDVLNAFNELVDDLNFKVVANYPSSKVDTLVTTNKLLNELGFSIIVKPGESDTKLIELDYTTKSIYSNSAFRNYRNSFSDLGWTSTTDLIEAIKPLKDSDKQLMSALKDVKSETKDLEKTSKKLRKSDELNSSEYWARSKNLKVITSLISKISTITYPRLITNVKILIKLSE